MAHENTIATMTQFFSTPELKEQYGGNYLSYLRAQQAALKNTSAFTYTDSSYLANPTGNTIWGHKQSRTTSNPITTEQEKYEELLSKVKDYATRKFIEENSSTGNLSQDFINMLIKRHEKNQAEFEEVWAQYQASKNQTAALKRICEILIRDYGNSEDIGHKQRITDAGISYHDSNLDTELLLDKAGMISHKFMA